MHNTTTRNREHELGDSDGIDLSAELRHHERWLRTVVLARSGDPQAVDEIMQEVALGMIKTADPPTSKDSTAPWLYRVAVRQSLLHRRQLGRRRRIEFRFAGIDRQTEGDSRELDPLAWLLADERRELIRTAVQRLHNKDAEVLLLKYTEEWSYRRIAEHLGIGEGAVESRLHRARKRLRRELATLSVIEATS